jgi:hypothetical protein
MRMHKRNKPSARQIENAKKFFIFNIGGSIATSVVMIWGRG